MNKSGFTLVEVLIIVLIIAVLSSIALPKYTRTVERARATEAFGNIQQIDDAVYAFYTERQACPTNFSQLPISLPVTSDSSGTVTIKNFTYTLNPTNTSCIPDTDSGSTCCHSTLATRVTGKYGYKLWRSYPAAGKTRTLCDKTNDTGKEICDMLELSAS